MTNVKIENIHVHRQEGWRRTGKLTASSCYCLHRRL